MPTFRIAEELTPELEIQAGLAYVIFEWHQPFTDRFVAYAAAEQEIYAATYDGDTETASGICVVELDTNAIRVLRPYREHNDTHSVRRCDPDTLYAIKNGNKPQYTLRWI